MPRYARSERFFLFMVLIMMAVIIAGFGSMFYFVPSTSFPPRGALILHAGVTFAWYALTALQALLIRSANFDLHRKLGWASIALALLILITGYVTTVNAVARPDWSINGRDPLASAIFPFFDLVTFAVFYPPAVFKRKDREAHKRLMVLAGVMMIDPAAARLGGVVLGSAPVIIAIEAGLLFSFLIYDWRTRGRPHWTSVLGTVVFFFAIAARFALAESEGWKAFAQAVFG